jgi:D-glycero-alpha-D-manno-heptose-7-phosphate kinase
MVTEFNNGRPLSVNIATAVDAPPGSGLGSSSALVVALVKAFAEYLQVPLGDYDIARLAFEIERVELGMAGGRQDQYAAAFGGCNFIEFLSKERVVVNPLRIHEMDRLELEASLVVCHTGRSRVSSEIIADQTSKLEQRDENTINAMHQIKGDAVAMKLCLLRGDVRGMSEVLQRSWDAKKRTSSSISNDRIEQIYEKAMANGAIAGKISGAGGGGFLMLMTAPERRQNLIRILNQNEWQVLTCYLTDRGAEAWCPRA